MLALDLSYHLNRKSGEIMRIMERGTSSVQAILNMVVFQVGPVFFDIAAAAVFFAWQFEAWLSIIVAVTLFSYVPTTVAITEWRAQFRRQLNALDNEKSQRGLEALLNYETVTYFCAEAHEAQRYSAAIVAYQAKEIVNLLTLTALNLSQSCIILLGLASGLILCTKRVTEGRLSTGDLVLFVTYLGQLFGPLNWFGSYYSSIQSNAIDLENLVDLLAIEPAIKDAPDARPLTVTKGAVAFTRVTFGYGPTRTVLDDVTFFCPGGTTLALVGSTGSGKSTICRLLFRQFSPQAGIVAIDGQDISRVTLATLRRAIGVVPQDVVLFNDTIEANIRYGRPGAAHDDVIAAATAAAIHESIVSRFPEGYATVVGERGLRLSGGEKQRVALARCFLKDPPIYVMDEATSALDSLTEREVQAALRAKAVGATMIVVAHRLSTVADAGAIVVLGAGRVLESGTHAALLGAGGEYSRMLARQGQETTETVPGASASAAVATDSVPDAIPPSIPAGHPAGPSAPTHTPTEVPPSAADRPKAGKLDMGRLGRVFGQEPGTESPPPPPAPRPTAQQGATRGAAIAPPALRYLPAAGAGEAGEGSGEAKGKPGPGEGRKRY